MPDAGEIMILRTIQDQVPALPVVIHTFLSDYTQLPADMRSSALVVKNGDSIDNLKKVVAQILEAKRQKEIKSRKDHGNEQRHES